MDIFRIEIITAQERNSAITTVKDVIVSVGGWIVSHQLFSNTSASINFEVAYRAVDSMIDKLERLDLHPTIINDCDRDKDGELMGGVALIFIHDEPEMKRDVPPFG